MAKVFRLLITGSRSWTDYKLMRMELGSIYHQLETQKRPVVLIHGAAKGADSMAGEIWKSLGGKVEEHPAQWSTHDSKCPAWHQGMQTCKRAGYRRNDQMVNLGVSMCLAFIKDNSRGATMTANLVKAAGIKIREFHR